MLTAAEKGINAETAVVDMSTKQQDSDDYRKISPLGILPALKEANFVVLGEHGTCVFVEGKGLGTFLAPRNAAVLAEQNLLDRHWAYRSTAPCRNTNARNCYRANG